MSAKAKKARKLRDVAMIDAADIVEKLRGRYSLPAWVLLSNVRDGTGMLGSRYADAVAINCYPSQGLELVGFEIKIARSDWLRELKNPDKAEAVACYCDRWYIVTSKREIIQPGELPAKWGHLWIQGSRVMTAVKADKLEPCPVDRAFLASLLRNACETTSDALAAARHEGRRRGEKDERDKKLSNLGDSEKRYAIFKDMDRILKEGLGIDEYYLDSSLDLSNVRDAVAFAMEHWFNLDALRIAVAVVEAHNGAENLVREVRSSARDILESIERAGKSADELTKALEEPK